MEREEPRSERLFPGWAALRRYDRRWLRGDLVAGCTVAAYLVPQVMAYATVAGLPPITGLWAIIPPLVLYAFLGTSSNLSVGPESTTALMTSAVVGPLAAGDADRYAVISASLAVVVGVICILCRLLRLGFVADLLSRPVLVGYMAGIGVIMIVGQLDRLTGVATSGTAFASEVSTFVDGLGMIHWPTLALGAATLVFLIVIQWRWGKAPGALLAVIAATLIVFILGLEAAGIRVVGPVPSGLPSPQLPSLDQMTALVIPAIGVVLVGYTDNMLTARAFAPRDGSQVNANQELLALGAANIGAGLATGFPVSSSASRTALAIAAQARSQLYSLVAVAWVVAVLFLLGPVLAHFPQAVLGAIVVYAAAKLFDIGGFVQLRRFRWSELALALLSFVAVIGAGVLYGILIAVGLSVVDMLHRVARPHDAVEGLVPGLAGMHDVDDFPEAREVPGLLVYRYDSPLFFANADNFRERALAAVAAESQPVRWFLLNMEANVAVDVTALAAVEALRQELVGRGIVFALARVKQDLLSELRTFGLEAKVGPGRIFPTLPTAVEGYRAWCRAQHESDPGEPAG